MSKTDEIDNLIDFIRSLYGSEGFIPLHEPRFVGNEKKYLNDCIDSTFVSSVGKYVNKFEDLICEFTGSNYAIATMNGTAALHTALVLAEVNSSHEVITQALTFVATANAIKYVGADPIFLDSCKDNLGLCPKDLKNFLETNTDIIDGKCINKKTGKEIKACLPMHTFGHPVKLEQILKICNQYNIITIEDSAESLGSYYKGKHTGTIAPIGILSFNGNKTITSGGGGIVLVQNEELAKKAKHITTTAKTPHPWKFNHSEVAFNYRLPNLNAALACAQMEQLPEFIKNKRETAQKYKDFFSNTEFEFIDEPDDSKSNFWLNAILTKNKTQRDLFLEKTNKADIMTRPIWELMPDLPAFKEYYSSDLVNARDYANRIVNIPSSVRVL